MKCPLGGGGDKRPTFYLQAMSWHGSFHPQYHVYAADPFSLKSCDPQPKILHL